MIFQAQRAIKEGARKWHTLSQAEKDRYVRNSLKARDEWVRAMENYRAKVQAFKRPPAPFAAFLRDYLHVMPVKMLHLFEIFKLKVSFL